MSCGGLKSVLQWAAPNYVAAVALVILAFIGSSLPQQNLKQEYGSLTIFTVPDTWSKYIGPGRYCESSKLSIRVDDGDTVQWPRKQRVQVKDFALDRSH